MQRFFGEVLFLALGLKPCVMLSNLPAEWRASFAEQVVLPSDIVSSSETADALCVPQLFTVSGRVQTLAEYDISGDLVLANSRHPLFADAKRDLHLRPFTAAPTTADTTQSIVSEDALARALDYPVALSECREPMVEVRPVSLTWPTA